MCPLTNHKMSCHFYIQLELSLYKQTAKLVGALVRQMEVCLPVCLLVRLSACLPVCPLPACPSSVFAALLLHSDRLHTISHPSIPVQSYTFLWKTSFMASWMLITVELQRQRHSCVSFSWFGIHEMSIVSNEATFVESCYFPTLYLLSGEETLCKLAGAPRQPHSARAD